MKLSYGAILSLLYCSAAASSAGHVFIYDPLAQQPEHREAQSVSPEAARLILAQRLGVSRYHSIKHANSELINQINTYGGRPQQFFRDSKVAEGTTDAHVLVWIEDVEDITAIIQDPSLYSAEFTISNPPSTSDNDRLIQDMTLQAEALPKKIDPMGWTFTVGIDAEAALSTVNKVETYNDYLSVFRADKANKASFGELSRTLDRLAQKAAYAAERGWGMTVVLMPPSSSHSKRSAHPYGTYDLPSHIEARKEKTEAILSPSSSQPSPQPQTPNMSGSDDFLAIQQANDSSPVLGILPSCFATQSACEKWTHGCSGRGDCLLLRKGESGSEAKVKDCYGCRCNATYVHHDAGMETRVKTTYWGGPACQKKDVSQPFWLFVGTGILLTFLISSGIGMLFSIGNEELPSVIGAGVSGPTRK